MSGAKTNLMTCFVDTNVWLYAFIETPNKEDHHKRQIGKRVI